LREHVIECILYRKYYRHYSSVVFSIVTFVYCLTHINKKRLAKPKVKGPFVYAAATAFVYCLTHINKKRLAKPKVKGPFVYAAAAAF
jgi:hypothetical protein